MSWKEEHVDILVLQLYVLTFYQMAAALDPRLSPDAQAANEIDFHPLRVFLDEHFSSLPDTTVTISPNAESSSICPHILDYRICPSLFRIWTCRATYHAEFILRHDQIPWLPRTWVCRALQRSLRHDGSGTMSSPIQDCPYSHASN